MQYKRKIYMMLATAAVSMLLYGCGITETAVDISELSLSCMGERLDISAVWTEVSARISAAEQERAEAQEALAESDAESDIEELMEIPKLPMSGEALSDFVPEGWDLLDSVELDFNKDKVTDYVGVLQVNDMWDIGWDYWQYPRILFAVAGDGDGGYQLSFQNINLIRNCGEGGVYGDPYLPLMAEKNSFTTFSYGGSAWKWGEAYTYTYKAGTWYLTQSEHFYGYGGYITLYEMNDWESGVGIREERSDAFSDMEKHWDEEKPEYDIIYEISLDEMPTLEQAGMRWWLAPDRMTDWEVKDIVFAEGITLPEDMVRLPDKASFQYNDEDCVLYVFSDEDSGRHYLAMYRFQDKVLSVLSESENRIDDLELYQGKLYYTTEIVENITDKAMRDDMENITESHETVGLILHRMDTDGTGGEVVFEYRYSDTELRLMHFMPPYLAFTYEISGGEIVMEVYIGNEKTHPFYRMNIDGSGLRRIGQVPSAAYDSEAASEAQTPEELLNAFLAGEIPAIGYNYNGEAFAYMFDDWCPVDEEDWYTYSVGERVDLDNDGEDELVVDGPYGGIYFDARNGQVYLLAEGEGTAGVLSYTYYDNAAWIVHRDTSHAGRQIYWLARYDGGGIIVDEFMLGAEYRDSYEYDENSDFTYRGKKISMEEYEALRKEIIGW